MAIELRPTAAHERRAAVDTFRHALLHPRSTDADWESPSAVPSWEGSSSISAWDGARCVGHVAGFHFRTLLPGGAMVPLLGVTRVGVLPTHTRQGILRGAMERLLTDARGDGFVLAGLRASESVIYGRFGFAVAAETVQVEITPREGGRVVVPVADGDVRFLAPEAVLEVVPALHARIGLDRVGTVERPDWMFARLLKDAAEATTPTHVVVHRNADGDDDGWAMYRVEWKPVYADRDGAQCDVLDLWGATPAVELALWQHVLDLDLISAVRASERPLDDTVRFAISDQRSYKVRGRHDEQWLRILDVDAALRARRYNPVGDQVTIAVHDPLFDDNDGVWRVSAAGAERSADHTGIADLEATVQGASGAFLGATSWHEMAAIGAVHEHRPGAVRLADQLFAVRPLPRCGTFY